MISPLELSWTLGKPQESVMSNILSLNTPSTLDLLENWSKDYMNELLIAICSFLLDYRTNMIDPN